MFGAGGYRAGGGSGGEGVIPEATILRTVCGDPGLWPERVILVLKGRVSLTPVLNPFVVTPVLRVSGEGGFGERGILHISCLPREP